MEENTITTASQAFENNVMNAIMGKPTTTATPVVSDSLTKGLGFHQFDGNVSVKEVMQQIGADFTVSKQHLIRIDDDIYNRILTGEIVDTPISIEKLIESHCATVNERDDQTLGVVGKDYGVIQNADGLAILDLVTNSSVMGRELKIVSAGLVHNSDPYVQVMLPKDGISPNINGDNSDTEFYAFFHTSHDATSSLKVSFTATRIICENTYLHNLNSSTGFIVTHRKNADKRIDLNNKENIERIKKLVAKITFFQKDYIEKMNYLAKLPVTEQEIDRYITKLIVPESLKDVAKQHNYDINLIDGLSVRARNQFAAIKDTIESGIGQDTNRGTRLMVFNGITNYYSHKKHGGKDDSDTTRAEKRLNSFMGGDTSNKEAEALAMLVA